MSILKTTLTGQHTNDIQTAVIFETRSVVAPPPIVVAVDITVFREGDIVGHSDFVLDATVQTHQINLGANFVLLDGRLKLDLNSKAVTFSGSLTFQGQVSVGMASAIVAVL